MSSLAGMLGTTSGLHHISLYVLDAGIKLLKEIRAALDYVRIVGKTNTHRATEPPRIYETPGRFGSLQIWLLLPIPVLDDGLDDQNVPLIIAGPLRHDEGSKTV